MDLKSVDGERVPGKQGGVMCVRGHTVCPA